MEKKRKKGGFVLCIKNEAYFESDEEELTSLEIGKVYPSLIDPPSEKLGFVRVIDESGEDYLYPRGYFEPVHLTELAEKTIFAYLDSSRKENLESQEF